MDNHKTGDAGSPFLAFSNDNESIAILKQFAASRGWPETIIHSGDINTSIEFLKSNPSPKVLFVDITSAETASKSIDALADVCDPTIKVIVSGKINEYSFYCWLVEVGISNYLLKPFTINALESAYSKSVESSAPHAAQVSAEPKKKAKIITVIGSRGGVGATTVAVNMAWILANRLNEKTVLLDFDPQLGTVALALDLEPGKGLRDALEKPDRIDGLFVDRVTVRVNDKLSIMSTEEPMDENIVPHEMAAEGLFKQCRLKYQYIVVDLPRTLSLFTRHAITHADHVVCVTEYTIAGLRESLRYLEYCRDVLKVKPPVFVANRVGLAGKHQMPQDEFEKGLGAKVSFNIPFILDAYASATSGEVLAEIGHTSPAVKTLVALTEHFAETKAETKEKPKSLLSSLLKGGA